MDLPVPTLPYTVSRPGQQTAPVVIASPHSGRDYPADFVAAARLDALAQAAGLRLLGGTPLFRLFEHPDAHRVFDRLGRSGVLVRPFEERPTWLRFGVPHRESDWRRLEDALAD